VAARAAWLPPVAAVGAAAVAAVARAAAAAAAAAEAAVAERERSRRMARSLFSSPVFAVRPICDDQPVRADVLCVSTRDKC